MRSIRRLGCKNIDFVGSMSSRKHRDKTLANEVIYEVSDKNHIPPRWDGHIESYCKKRDWLLDDYKGLTCNMNLPFMNMVTPTKKQYVIGRMKNLKEYYACSDLFYTLDSEDWDSLYQINDLFVYCAATSEENVFPIRIVTKDSIRNKSSDDGISNYAVLTIPHLLNQWKKIHISARELCQISEYFKMYIYQSKEHPNIFFASKKKPSSIKRLMNIYKLKQVVIS